MYSLTSPLLAYWCVKSRILSFMLTLESRRFPVMGEVSLCIICLISKETEQGVTLTLFIYQFVATNTFNCHDTIAFMSSCQMVRYSNGGLKTGLKKPEYGPKCPVFKWSTKLCDLTIWIPDIHSVQYSDESGIHIITVIIKILNL